MREYFKGVAVGTHFYINDPIEIGFSCKKPKMVKEPGAIICQIIDDSNSPYVSASCDEKVAKIFALRYGSGGRVYKIKSNQETIDPLKELINGAYVAPRGGCPHTNHRLVKAIEAAARYKEHLFTTKIEPDDVILHIDNIQVTEVSP